MFDENTCKLERKHDDFTACMALLTASSTIRIQQRRTIELSSMMLATPSRS